MIPHQYNGRPNADVVESFTEYYKSYAKDEIGTAALNGDESITFDLKEIYTFNRELAEDIVDHPVAMMHFAEVALQEISLPDADAEANLDTIDVRFNNVGWEVGVSELRTKQHEDKLLGLRGQAAQVSQVQPKTVMAYFRCERCSDGSHEVLSDAIPQHGDEYTLPEECPSCNRSGPWSISDESVKVDHQIVELRDEPGEAVGVNSNKVPVHLYGDIAGSVNPGDTLRVNGYVQTEQQLISANQKVSTRTPWKVDASSIDHKEMAFEEVTPDDIDEIKELAQKENVLELFVESFAPDIITGERGDKHKSGIIHALFGASKQNGQRGDINIILVGEPGTAKSQYLKRAREIAPLAVEASGKGATAAGLTATARKSEYDEGYVLDAGALAVGSGGIACIDEFDKMGNEVRKSMHEAMENQRVPITKAGINTTIKTETAIIAAANPIGGTFDRFTPMKEQLNLGPTLLSRFDLKFGVSDTHSPEKDAAVAMHQHDRGTGNPNEQPLSDELMGQYIAYARQNIHPDYESDEVKQKLVDYYVEKRDTAFEKENQPPTPRMNDALRRLAQASARTRLSETITMEDADRAIDLMDLTIGDSALNKDGDIDFADETESAPKNNKERIETLLDACSGASLTKDEILLNTKLSEDNIDDVIQKAKDKGRLYEPKRNENGEQLYRKA